MNAVYAAGLESHWAIAIAMETKTMPWVSVVAHASRMQMVTVFATILTTAWVLTTRLMYAMGPVKPMLMKMGFVIPMKWLDVRILQRVILIH